MCSKVILVDTLYKRKDLLNSVIFSSFVFIFLFQSPHGANQARVLTHLLAMEAGSQAHSLGRWATFNMTCPAGISEILQFLLKDSVDLNNPPSTLAAAVSTLPETSIQSLIAHSADVKSQYDDGETCAHVAVRVNSEHKFRLIVQSGADLSTKWHDMTALESVILYYPNGNIMRCIDTYLKTFSAQQLFSLAR